MKRKTVPAVLHEKETATVFLVERATDHHHQRHKYISNKKPKQCSSKCKWAQKKWAMPRTWGPDRMSEWLLFICSVSFHSTTHNNAFRPLNWISKERDSKNENLDKEQCCLWLTLTWMAGENIKTPFLLFHIYMQKKNSLRTKQKLPVLSSLRDPKNWWGWWWFQY